MRMQHRQRGKSDRIVAIVLLIAAFGAVQPVHAQTPPLLAGVAVTDITPPVGYRHYRGTSTGVHDPLQAKALVFRQGDREAALVVADLTSVTQGLSAEVRTLASERTGIPYDNIIVAASHTHTGPEYREEMEAYVQRKRAGKLTPEDEQGYLPQLIRSVAQAIIDADAAARPVQLQTAVGEAEGISFNRRFHMKNGRVRMNPGVGNPDIVRPAGPVDTDVSILMLRPATGGDPFASLTVFANHLDTVGGTDFSADYPYWLAESLQESFGEDFVSVFGTGTTGDINHINVKGRPNQSGHEAVTRRTGETLGRVVKEEVKNLKEVERPSLGFRSEYVYAPLQEYTEKELAWAKGDSKEPLHEEREFLQGMRRRKILSLERMRKTGAAVPPTVGTEPWMLPLEVQVIRLGEDAAIVGLPGEVFVELGMAIEEASPFARTYVIELTNVNIAYVPTREGFAQGDYEAVNSRVAPGGGEMLVDIAVRLLQELKQEQGRTASGEHW
jgi:neutral ceramidase